ncbi:MAG: ABC transporter permease [Ignavibacteriae bacterium]|nr:ABC transporter permease [Ignavibacteriota bacterium]
MKNNLSARNMSVSLFHRRSPAIFFLVVFILLSCLQWKLIIASIVSVVLTPAVLLTTAHDTSRFFRSDLWEYWIAAICWIIIAGLCIHGVKSRLSHSTRCTANYSTQTETTKSPLLTRVSLYTLIVFICVALMAPFVAPCNPTSQGDLLTTRLLKPMESGIAIKKTMTFTDDEQSTQSLNTVENILYKANVTLVDREEKFARQEHLEKTDDQAETVQYTIFILGTDNLGRDVLSRSIYGTRISLGIGLTAVVCSVLLGCLIGFSAGLLGSFFDKLLMRFTDLSLAIPSLFLVITMVAFFGNSTLLVIVALAVTGWMSVARLVRAEVLSLREREFILAATMLGQSRWNIVLHHIVPNVSPTILTASILQLGNVILAEAALSFLGLGVQPPTPSWGNMIGESMAYIDSAYWVGIFPGLFLSLLVLSVNILADSFHQTINVQA